MKPSLLLMVTALWPAGTVQTASTPALRDSEPPTELSLEVGATFHLVGTEHLTAEFNVPYMTAEFEITVEQSIDVLVVEQLASSDYLLKVTLGRARGKVTTPLGEESFDSETPPEVMTTSSSLYLHYIAPAGKAYQAVLSKRGVVKEVRGFAALFEDTECGKLMEIMGMPYEDEADSTMLQWVLPPLPAPSSLPNVKWQTSYPLRLLGETILFAPRCVIETPTSEAESWSFATEVEGTPLTEKEIEEADDQAPLYEWYSKMSKLSTAGLSGRVRLSKEDGMLIEHDIEVELAIGILEQQHGVPAAIELVWKRETRRRAPEEETKGGGE